MATKGQVQAAVDSVLDAQEELVRRGTDPGAALILCGLALGVLLGGSMP